MTHDEITKVVTDGVADAVEYAEQLSRYVLDDLLTDEQEVYAHGIIIDSAVLGIVCALAPALGIPAPEEARDRATRALNHLFETDWGSAEDEEDEE